MSGPVRAMRVAGESQKSKANVVEVAIAVESPPGGDRSLALRADSIEYDRCRGYTTTGESPVLRACRSSLPRVAVEGFDDALRDRPRRTVADRAVVDLRDG